MNACAKARRFILKAYRTLANGKGGTVWIVTPPKSGRKRHHAMLGGRNEGGSAGADFGGCSQQPQQCAAVPTLERAGRLHPRPLAKKWPQPECWQQLQPRPKTTHQNRQPVLTVLMMIFRSR